MTKQTFFATLFFLSAMFVQAQTREDFVAKLEAINMDNKKEQLAVLDQALKAFPKDADLYSRRADLKTTMEQAFSKKDTYGFMADYTKAIEFENVSWRYGMRANGKMLLEDYKGALADCNTAVTMAEKAGEKEHIFSAYFGRINANAFLKDYKSALADTEVAIKNNFEPNGSFVATMLSSGGDFAEELSDFELAIKYFERAATIYKTLSDDTEGLMYMKMGEVKAEKMNNPKDGCVYFKKALAINDGGIFKNDINAKIKKYCK